VSRVQASAHFAGRAYVSKSGYKFDDFKPYLYRTDDYGKTWKSIVGNLPDAPINVVVEDRKNPNLLFVGNDVGVYVTIDGGAHWVKMNNNMPRVVLVHDMLIHPRENDLVVGTYGRGIYFTNIEPLQEMTPAMLAEDVHLFDVQPAVQRVTYQFGANDYLFGQRYVQTPNEQNGMVVRYYRKAESKQPTSIVITNAQGQEVARFDGPSKAGLNCVVWDMRTGGRRRGGRSRGPCLDRPVGDSVSRARNGGQDGTTRPRSVIEQLAPLGDYTVTLQSGTTKLTRPARVTATQGWRIGPVPEVIR
jgi:hypothetical protein